MCHRLAASQHLLAIRGRVLLASALGWRVPNSTPGLLQHAEKRAVVKVGVASPAHCDPYVNHLLDRGQGGSTIQELLGDQAVSTTMSDTHGLNCGPGGGCSPAVPVAKRTGGSRTREPRSRPLSWS